MNDRIAADLAKEEQSEFHTRLLNDSKALLSLSRRKMNEFYPTWDANDDLYRGIRQPDKADIAAGERGEPKKMVVPIAYSQVQTFVAFCMSLFTQRDRMFELVGFTAEDEAPAKVGESLISRDLAHNNIKTKLNQFLLDIARCNMGVFKVSWVTEKQRIVDRVELPPSRFMGIPLGGPTMSEEEKEIVAYQGNRIMNISPYRFYPDVRLPFVRFQEGEFCGSEDLFSYSSLKKLEDEGEVSGVQHIKQLGQDVWQSRGFRWNDWMSDSVHQPYASVGGDGQMKKLVIVAEIQRRIVPSEYLVDGEPIGDEDYPVMYQILIANDNRVIKAEPMGYLHDQFTYVLAPYGYDNNTLLGSGLMDTISYLQDTITWMVNARITSVRKCIDNKFLVNTKYVNMSDLENRRPIIRLNESAPGDIDRHIKQLDVQDVTSSHIGDVKFLHELVQVVTGINDALLGQFQPGRRSATEHRNVTAGSAARLKTVAQVIYDFALEPMARQMLSNLRDGLDEETYVRLLGTKATEVPEFIQVTKEDLVGHYDFEFFDGTLPSERQQQAQVLEPLVTAFIANPEAGLAVGYDVRKLLNEWLLLRGIKNPERFMVEPQPQVLQPPVTGGPNGENTNAATVGAGAVPTGIPSPVAQPVLPGTNGAVRT